MLKTSIELAVDVTTISEKYSKLGWIQNTSFLREDKQFFRSCSSLRWNIGNSFKLETGTFRRIMKEIVVSSVINLLIAY